METPSGDNMESSISQFCAITGADEEVAKRTLEACSGDLQVAVNMHVDSEATDGGDGDSSRIENVRSPIPPCRAVLVEESLHVGFQERRRPAMRSVFDGFRDFQAETRWQEEMCNLPNRHISKKRKTLEDLFRPPLDLIHRGSFESAREAGQRNNRWLLVNIQNAREFQCQVLNRDVWSNPAVKGIVADYFIFWQVYSDSEEGQRYMQFYKVLEFPYLAILDPRTGETIVVWNKIDSASFCDLITDFLSEQPAPDGPSNKQPKKKAKQDSILDKSEEEQLKAAIEASLQDTAGASSTNNTSEPIDVTYDSDSNSYSDTEKSPDDSQKQETKDQVDHKQNDTKHSPIVSSQKENNKVDKTEDVWQDYLGDDNDPVAELILRFPNGERRQLRLPSTSKLQALLLYVMSQGYNEEEYELITTFPRRQLYQFEKTLTLKEVGLFPQETVFVQLKS